MSIFKRKNKYRRKRIDDVSYVYTLGEFLFNAGDTFIFVGKMAMLLFLALALYHTAFIWWDKGFMHNWFSQDTKKVIMDWISYVLFFGLGLYVFSIIVKYILCPLCSLFKREFHNYTMLITILSFVSLALSKVIPNYWLGFVAIPGLIMFIMWGLGLIIGILDLIW